MNHIMKYVAVFLVLFALMGTASAAVSSVSATAEPNGTASNGTDIFDVSVTWDGEPANGNGMFGVSIEDTNFTNETTNTSFKFIGLPLDPGTYIVTVKDGSSGEDTGSFTLPPPPTVNNVVILNSSMSTFDVTWGEWTSNDNETLEIHNGSNWITANSPATVTSNNNTTDTNIIFRTNNNGTFSGNTTALTIKPITFSSEITADSIKWTIHNYTALDAENVSVTGQTTGPLSTVATFNNTVTASNLTPTEIYTLKVRGVDNASSPKVYSLFFENSITFEAPTFIDTISAHFNNSTQVAEPFSTENGTVLTLNVTAKQPADFKWVLTTTNGTTVSGFEVDHSSNSSYSNFSWKPSALGTYNLTLIVSGPGTTTPNQTVSWNIAVTEKSTGNRIWQTGMPTTYTWDARSFAGFYYDLDTGIGSEFMRIENIGQSIDRGDIYYQTSTSNVSYEYDGWGEYQIVGFMGDKYYAGSGSDSLMKGGNLSKVLIDSDESNNYRLGQAIALEGGYAINISQIDVNGNAAYIIIEKDGKEVGGGIVNPSGQDRGTLNYTRKIGNENVSIIKVHVDSVFMGSESSLVTINGIFQISDNMTKLESGTKIDKMEIDTVSGDTITMTNSERVSLSRDSNVTLMGKMKFIVADSDILRFAPTIEYTEPGTYEIRGTVSDYSNGNYIIKEWTPQNFEGFYYDINDDIETSEQISINQDDLSDSSRRIDKGNITYTSKTTTVDYEFDPWGEYTVIGFMGEKYYAGVDGSLIKSGNLSKVLIDDNERRNMNVGQYITLEEGYSIKIDQIDVNGNRTYFKLEKDGRQVDDGVISSGSDYVYKKNISNTDVELVKVRVDSVFMGTESSLVSISGIFQASDNLTKLESDTKYGKMKVDSYSSTGISLSSDESITLSSGNDVDFMKVGNNSMYFKVGDNSTLRYAPVVEKEIGSNSSLEIEFSPREPVAGDTVQITVKDRGTTIEGVTVTVNGSSLGTTNSSGAVNYSANNSGTFRVTAEKSGYVNGSATLKVNEKLGNMTVTVTPETLYYGTAGTIKVTDSLNGSAVSGATIRLGDSEIGSTGSNGELSYTFNLTGNATLQASKSGYNNVTKSLAVTQKDAFNYSNFTMKPESPAAKSAIKLSFDAANVGIEDGSHTLKLVLKDSNGTVIDEDSKSISVDTGKTKSFSLSVKAPSEGSYTLTLTESDSNRTIDLPSSMSSLSVGEAKLFGSTLVYVILAIVVLILLAVIGFVAYLFGVKGATKDNYQDVAQDVISDIKMKFQRK